MEKISSILPTSARVKSVDLEDSHPIRPGTPTFGRRVGSTSSQRVQDKVSISEKAKELLQTETIAGKNSKEDKGAKIADDITKKFFMTRLEKPKAQPDFVTEDVQDLASEVTAMSAPVATPMSDLQSVELVEKPEV